MIAVGLGHGQARKIDGSTRPRQSDADDEVSFRTQSPDFVGDHRRKGHRRAPMAKAERWEIDLSLT